MLDSLDTLIAFVLIMLVVSLLITIAVQMLAAVLNLRGVNLLYGLRNTFHLISPELVQNTTDLARSVLKGRLVSDSFLPNWRIVNWWRHASAIRPDEAFDSIHRLALAKKSPDNQCLRQSAQNLLVALGMDRQLLENAATQILQAQQDVKGFADDAKAIVQSISDKTLRNKLELLANSATAKVGAIGADAVAAADQALVGVASSIDAAYQRFQFWMDICQERVQQWFTTHTRIITVVVAIFFTVGFQLDSSDIFKLVSSNRALREKLVAQSSAILSQAEKVIGDRKTALQQAYEQWFPTLDAKTKDALKSITVEPTDTPEQVLARVKAALPSAAEKDALGQSFESTVKKAVGDKTTELSRESSELNKKLADAGFDLVPKDGFGRRWGKNWKQGWQPHIWGLLFSIGLLSLGAPFWYNALKNLVSLRSTVAQNMSKEQAQDQKQPDGSKPKPPPPSLVPPRSTQSSSTPTKTP